MGGGAMTKVLTEKLVHDGHMKIVEGEIRSHGKVFTKLKLKREDAVAILVVNTDTAKVILTKQFRYPIADKASDDVLEIVAGKIDDGEASAAAAIREVEEEIGYRIREENLKYLFSCFASPGYSSERFEIFYAQVTDQDKVDKGGGLPSENENIQVVEIPVAEFNEKVRKAQLSDAKTYIAGAFLALNNVLP